MTQNDNESVKVSIRVRPLVSSETDRGCCSVVEKTPNEPQLRTRTGCIYTFDHVYTENDSQQYIYESSVQNMIDNLFNGYNVTIFAYGQTGSGKTHTMGTTFDGNFNESIGIIPRAIQDIFYKIEQSDDKISVHCSFMELYQENLFDLLSNNSREDNIVDIKEDNKEIVIPGMSEIPVTTVKETIDCLIRGSSGRAVGATAMNAQSSRSHAIFTIKLRIYKKGDINNSITAKFHLVDLAGSERSKKTKATGERFKEGVKINQGLLALGNVISALGSEQQTGFVSYRNSKLTRLLQDSLGGNSVTLMIACISPADYNLEETISTLRYADRAKKIKNKPIVNQDPKSAEIENLKALVQNLRLQLLGKRRDSILPQCNGGSINQDDQQVMNNLKKDLVIATERIVKLQCELQATINDLTNVELRAIVAETANEDLQKLVIELQTCITDLNASFDQETCPAEFFIHKNSVTKIKALIDQINDVMQKRKEEINKLNISTKQSTDSINGRNSLESEEMQQKLEACTSKQLGFNTELRSLNELLAQKEELHKKCMENMLTDQDNDGKDKDYYEGVIIQLEKERDDLNDKLKSTKSSLISTKLAEERRKRLQQLEQEITNMKKKILQQSNLLKVREKDALKVASLTSEIQAMKAAKVKLIRAMRVESDRYRTWKLEREKEMCQLREQNRKRQNEMKRMQALHHKQNNVLKRKFEEAMAKAKRLEINLERQKHVQAQRKIHNVTKNSDNFVAWLEHEVEVMNSVVDAKISLDHMMEDRGIITTRLNEMEENPMIDPSEIDEIKEDLDLRNTQISDLQKKIIDWDVEQKAKTISEGMQSMPEARIALKYLFTAIAEMRKDCASKESITETMKCEIDDLKEKIINLEKEKQIINDEWEEKLNKREKDFEEKVGVLLRRNNKNGEGESNEEECMKILWEEIESIRKENESLKLIAKEHKDLTKFIRPSQINAIKKLRDEANYSNIFSDDDQSFIDDPNDPDWHKTPKMKNNKSRKDATSDSEDMDEKIAIKRKSDGVSICHCKTDCSKRICGCRKSGSQCSDQCKCSESCVNNHSIQNGSKNDESVDGDGDDDDDKENTPKKSRLENSLAVYTYSLKKRKPFYN